MRRLTLICALLVAAAAALATTAGADDTHTYEIEMYNAFGIVEGSYVRIAGVNAGSVTDLGITPDKTAVVTVKLSGDLGTLGEDTKCSSEPQSLIAEYFISCEPAGPPIVEDDDSDDPKPDIPASQVEQTVQPDLVQDTLREPFKRRLGLLINEFGTALAGNSDRLNEAIRLGAPALTQLQEATRILASHNRIIRDLNVNSDRIIARLNERSADVVRFVKEARDTATISASRGESLSHDFGLLDNFLAELRPTLADLEDLTRQQTPLLTDLRGAAPGLNTLATNLPDFNRATAASLDTLGDASVVGDRALSRGRDEIAQLAETSRNAPLAGEVLADFLRDLDDPRRAVEIDQRVARDTGRDDPRPGRKDTEGYTGLEGLLNYVYYQAGAVNQFDQTAHLLHIGIFDVATSPCRDYNAGGEGENFGVPAAGGGTTTDILKAHRCVSWLGARQPDINYDLGLPPYDPSVCPDGSTDHELCDPAGSARPTGPGHDHGDRRRHGDRAGSDHPGGGGSAGASVPAPGGGAPGAGPPVSDVLGDILDDLPPDALDNLPGGLGDALNHGGDALNQGQGGNGPAAGATGDLLDFLFTS